MQHSKDSFENRSEAINKSYRLLLSLFRSDHAGKKQRTFSNQKYKMTKCRIWEAIISGVRPKRNS